MQENLVIVESPAKAKTIEKFLGKGYVVTSSFGHIRDLSKKDFGIDIENNYEPIYEISPDKKKVVDELKKMTKKADVVWIASDEDREGEAIAWHLFETLELDLKKTKRIVFHEITKEAILKAIENPRSINQELVNAQQARRVLDRLVGFELSPVLWKKIKPSLSAGRVQSVAVRLLVEREREIINFKTTDSFRIIANFTDKKNKANLKAELSTRFKTQKEAEEYLKHCQKAVFKVESIVKKPAKRTPAAPFTTSTLQQEASSKFGFSVSQTMMLAQKLYEAGKITYMRTDSVNLAEAAVKAAEKQITEQYGKEYLKIRTYKTKAKAAQEAHEAIRPTYLDKRTVSGNTNEKKLYELIWKRTIASLMSDAELEKTNINIDVSDSEYNFLAQGEMIKFDGFLKVYSESKDDDENNAEAQGLLPQLDKNEELEYKKITATQKFTHHPPRFTEASLVRKLEELGIGRPSTYAPTISTIQNRNYVVKEKREGVERKYIQIVLEKQKIEALEKVEITGAENNKLFPTDIGMVVNDYLLEQFPTIMDFNFTAEVEKEFDDISIGKLDWTKMIDRFYKPFHETIEAALKISERKSGEKLLGNDPQTGKPVFVKIGRYGPMAQIGENSDEEKPKFASLQSGQHLETITLEEALKLFILPRDIGEFEDKKVVTAIGRFGPYVRHDSKFYALKKGIDDPYTIEIERAIELINEKREADKNKIINTFETPEGQIQVLNGRYGPYIAQNKKNYKIPKSKDAKSLTLEECKELIEKAPEKKTKTKKKK